MTTLIGTNPDQIPVNSMLGGMAYQDPDSINVKDFKYSGTLSGLGNSSIVSTSGDVSSTVHANNATGGAIAILKAGDGTSSSYYSYLRIINNDSSPKTWDIGTRGNDNLHIYDGTTTRVMVSSGTDHVQFNSGNTSFFIGNGATAGGGTTDDTSFNWSLGGAVKLCRNSTLVAEIDSSNNLIMKTTGALKVSEGTTAQRPASPQEGMIRKNSTLGVIEGYSGGGYVSLEAGRLIKVTANTVSGHSSITLDSKTNYVIAEMIGGGGAGGNIQTGPYSANFVCIAGSGSPGRGVRLLLQKQYLQNILYYYVGAGASSGGGSGSDGANGLNTILSFESTTGATTNYYSTGGGKGGAGNNTSALPPVTHSLSNYPGVTKGGMGVNWEELEVSEIRGDSRAVLNSAGGLVQSGQYLVGLSVSPMTCFSQYGAGGLGGLGGQVWAGYSQGSSGAQGMIRIYEYS